MSKDVNQTNKKAPDNRSEIKDEKLKNKVYSLWLGWRDSNPRMPGPKPGALPLGHIPLQIKVV